MNIRIDNSSSFKSKAYPINSFTVKTKRGKLKICEVTQKDLRRENFIPNLTRFFCKNFASLTKDPAWKAFQRKNGIHDEHILEDFIKYYTAKINSNDKNMTLLLAKDKRNKIQGACLSYGCDRIPDAADITCYIDSIAVNPAFRGFKIGKILLEKTLESAKNKFTDAFLTGDKEAHGFYKKMEFVPLSADDIAQKNIIDFIEKRRSDYPKYVNLYTKALNEKEERWYNIISIND